MVDDGKASISRARIDRPADAAAESGCRRVAGFPLIVTVHQVVDGTQIIKQIETQAIFIAQDTATIDQVSDGQFYGYLATVNGQRGTFRQCS